MKWMRHSLLEASVCFLGNEQLAERGSSMWNLCQEPPYQEFQVKSVFSQQKMTNMKVHNPLLLQISRFINYDECFPRYLNAYCDLYKRNLFKLTSCNIEIYNLDEGDGKTLSHIASTKATR